MAQASPADVGPRRRIAARAGAEWAARTPGERARVLLRLADLLEEDGAELTRLEVEETGKPVAVVADGELPFAADNLRFFAGSARSLEGSGAGILSHGYTSMLLRRPVGVVGSIAPWNFPLVMAIWKLGPALAAGNTVVLKPAPSTPRSTLRLAELAAEAGLPPGVLSIVTGGADVGEALVRDPSVRMVSVTGSTAHRPGGHADGGRLDRSACTSSSAARRPRWCSRTLTSRGAHEPSRSAPPTTPARTARPPRASTSSAHGSPTSSTPSSTTMAAVRFGDPLDAGTDVGPLISPAHRDRVHGFVSRAVEAGRDGARPAASVPDSVGSYYPPTVVVGARQDSEIVQGEVFGPVLVVRAVRRRGRRRRPRQRQPVRTGQSSVWTSDVGRALRVSHRVEAGVTWINDHLPIASEAPHGGVKGSGFGKDMSHEAVLEYTVTHHVMIKHAQPQQHDSFRPA